MSRDWGEAKTERQTERERREECLTGSKRESGKEAKKKSNADKEIKDGRKWA